MHSKYPTVKLTIVMLIITFHIYSVGRVIHSLIYVVCLDLLYWLFNITHKSGYRYPTNTMYSHATYVFARCWKPSCRYMWGQLSNN